MRSEPSVTNEAKTHTVRPAADVYETDEAWFLILEMPGVDQHGTDVSMEKNVLTVRGEVDAFDTDGFEHKLGSFSLRHFERSFRMPEDIDRTAIDAEVKNGILRLRLPKVEAAMPHKVTVKAG